MREEDKVKIRTAATIFLLQHPEGLTANELANRINHLPLGIRKGRGYLTSAQVSHYLKNWTGFTSKNHTKKKERILTRNKILHTALKEVKGWWNYHLKRLLNTR